MPPRPAVKGKEGRPVSAIYLGSGSKQTSSSNSGNGVSPTLPHTSSSSSPHPANPPPANLPEVPDLPEPPSPSSSEGSRQSGLPSPPATNSTGSGSTGDPGSVARRQRPLSFASESSASTSSSSHKTMSTLLNRNSVPSGSRSSSRLADAHDPDDEDDDDDLDNDGDNTARLDRLHHVKSSSENVRALQRAMSLTQRNKLAIDKLTRLGSPSPRSRSPSHASTTSSSRLRQVRTVSQPALPDTGLSGSETEREEGSSLHTYSTHSQSSSSHASSSRRPITPTSNAAKSNISSPPARLRHISAPGSPNHARLLTAASRGSNLSNSPTSRRRKRASMATMTSITQTYEDEEDEPINDNHYGVGRDRLRNDTIRDITQSALAAVASSRRSPLGTRRRAALPREFREDLSNNTNTPDTASVTSDARTRRSEDFDSRPNRLSIEPMTPYRNGGVGRSATVREVRRSGGPSRLGFAGEDHLGAVTPEHSPTDAAKRERRQTLRGGSAESALRSPGRTLLGEGLRAAGLTRRDDQKPDRGDLGPKSADLFRDRRVEFPADDDTHVRRRTVTYGRSATAMGDYRLRQEADEFGGREARIRTHRSTYSLAQDGEPSVVRQREFSLTRPERDQLPPLKAPIPHSTAAPIAKAIPQHLQERYLTASPIGVNRQSTPAPGSAEHGRLMVESMALFESTVVKLPSVVTGVSSLGSIPSSSTLVKNAQVLVNAAERVNELMRAGTTRALEEQINAEVEGNNSASGQEMLEVWRQVGGEYREGLRASDELVRALTSFLMDTGSIMRKLASAPAVSEIGSPAVHGRSISLDEEVHRSQPRLNDSSDGSGRESRSGWEPSIREREREETLRKLAGISSGRESSLAVARASPALAALRDRERAGLETPSPASSSRPLPSIGSSNPVRRLFTPREPLRPLDAEEQRCTDAQPSTLQPSDSQKTLQAESVEPSPTPVSRTIGRDRSRTLPPIPQPPPEPARRTPVSTKPPVTRVDTRPESVRDRTHERRKPSVASIATVRGSGPTFSSLTTPSSATAVITHHTVSSSPEVARSNSDRSVGSSVTFSHPSSASSAALSDIQQQAMVDERRRGGDQQQQDTPASSSSVFKTPARPTASSMARAKSVSEGVQRRTIGTRTPRASLDGEAGAVDSPSATKNSTAHAADRSAVLTALPSVRREKRRTVTDIFPHQ